MPERTTPPFRADHVGSLLRPPALLDARRRRAAGEISAAQLREAEDAAILEAVRRQEAMENSGAPGSISTSCKSFLTLRSGCRR
jgi:5-methyltetrahydropteroyltriglutamate--homocysteine methyltransferase